jgi:hypothetical protein
MVQTVAAAKEPDEALHPASCLLKKKKEKGKGGRNSNINSNHWRVSFNAQVETQYYFTLPEAEPEPQYYFPLPEPSEPESSQAGDSDDVDKKNNRDKLRNHRDDDDS